VSSSTLGGDRSEGTLGRTLLALQTATLQLAGAASLAEAADTVLHRAAPTLGASSASLWLLNEEGGLEFTGGYTFDPSVPQRFAVVPADSDLPGPIVVRTGEPVFYHSLAERDRRWPRTAGTPSASEAMAVLPLDAGFGVVGCLAIGIADARPFTDDELLSFRALADHCAVALDRIRAREAEGATAELVQFLLSVSTELMGTLERSDVFRRLIDLVVPRLADWAAVYLPAGDLLERVAVRLSSAERHLEEKLVNRFPTRIDSDAPVAVAFRTGDVQVVRAIVGETLLASTDEPEFADIIGALRLSSAIALPIRAGDEIDGVVTLAFSSSTRVYDESLIAAATAVVARVAVALENARLYEDQRNTAITLARAVLPERLPELEGIGLGACYLPAHLRGVAVGGDWYDAFLAPDRGRLVVGVGDAAGHGLPAASAMAKLRNAARAFVARGADAGALLHQLSDLLNDSDASNQFATAVYATLDLDANAFRWSSAGHMVPVLLRDGVATHLVGEIGAPLGAITGDLTTNEFELRSDDLVVLYTDGVVEVRGEHLDDGLQRLLAAIAQAGVGSGAIRQGGLDGLCAGLVDIATAGNPREDDCCVLVIHVV
jgi:serine/threonine-protein kinase RsbW